MSSLQAIAFYYPKLALEQYGYKPLAIVHIIIIQENYITEQAEKVNIFSLKGPAPTMQELICFPSAGGRINLVKKIGGEYFPFGILLLEDDDGSKVSSIEKELLKNAEDINRRIFTLWLSGKGKHPVTWSTLIGVLQDIELNKLAETIANVKHC